MENPLPVASASGFIHVEADAFVLGLFDGVPLPHFADAWVHFVGQLIVGEHLVSQHGCEVFYRTGNGQPVFRRDVFFEEESYCAFLSLYLCRRIAERVEVFAEHMVLVTVNRFLFDEILHLLLQAFVFHQVFVVTDCIDKQALALQEQARKRVHQGAFKGVIAVPVTRQVFEFESEVHFTAMKFNARTHIAGGRLFISHSFIQSYNYRGPPAIRPAAHGCRDPMGGSRGGSNLCSRSRCSGSARASSRRS